MVSSILLYHDHGHDRESRSQHYGHNKVLHGNLRVHVRVLVEKIQGY
jgi:hypothetical protein